MVLNENLPQQPKPTSISARTISHNGATDAEIDILLSERVELNALTSDQLIAMIERKLKESRHQEGHPGR